MSWNNRVIWSEGLFLRPQHFQQHDRWLESLVDARSGALAPYPWGFRELEIDAGLLGMGQLGLTAARGVLPDGTPFGLPADDPAPAPLELPDEARGQVVYLALPVRRPGGIETGGGDEGLQRFTPGEEEVKDNNAGTQEPAALQVGRLHPRLLLEKQNRDGFACLGVARILDLRPDKGVVLDEAWIPPCLDVRASPRLAGFLNELQGLLRHRGEALAGRISGAGQGGVAEVSDFMLLQVINRYEPLAAHLAALPGLHGELLYRRLLELAGELASFTRAERRPPQFPVYTHEDPQAAYDPLLDEIRDALSKVMLERAIPIPLQDRKYGFRVAPISDRTLLGSASFVLAAKADISAEALRRQFPAQVKVGPVEQIQQFVKLALPGIGLHPLPVAPRQIPYHAGYNYFELDRNSEYWKGLEQSGGFALHIGGEFPGLKLEFWAIRD